LTTPKRLLISARDSAGAFQVRRRHHFAVLPPAAGKGAPHAAVDRKAILSLFFDCE